MLHVSQQIACVHVRTSILLFNNRQPSNKRIANIPNNSRIRTCSCLACFSWLKRKSSSSLAFFSIGCFASYTPYISSKNHHSQCNLAREKAPISRVSSKHVNCQTNRKLPLNSLDSHVCRDKIRSSFGWQNANMQFLLTEHHNDNV